MQKGVQNHAAENSPHVYILASKKAAFQGRSLSRGTHCGSVIDWRPDFVLVAPFSAVSTKNFRVLPHGGNTTSNMEEKHAALNILNIVR